MMKPKVVVAGTQSVSVNAKLRPRSPHTQIKRPAAVRADTLFPSSRFAVHTPLGITHVRISVPLHAGAASRGNGAPVQLPPPPPAAVLPREPQAAPPLRLAPQALGSSAGASAGTGGGSGGGHAPRELSPAEITACGALSKLAASVATYPSQVRRPHVVFPRACMTCTIAD